MWNWTWVVHCTIPRWERSPKRTTCSEPCLVDEWSSWATKKVGLFHLQLVKAWCFCLHTLVLLWLWVNNLHNKMLIEMDNFRRFWNTQCRLRLYRRLIKVLIWQVFSHQRYSWMVFFNEQNELFSLVTGIPFVKASKLCFQQTRY